MRDTGAMSVLPKKEQLQLQDQIARLDRLLGGIRGMRRLPDVLFVIDTKKEHIAIHEAQRLDIPVVALLDTNSDPDDADFAIPANDDAIRAVRLLSGKIADAALEGAQEYQSTRAKEEAEEGFEPAAFESYSFEPEGYDASLEAGASNGASEEFGAASPQDAVRAQTLDGEDEATQQAQEAADPRLRADSDIDTQAPVDEDQELRELDGQAAFVGDVSPALSETGLGVHPDAGE